MRAVACRSVLVGRRLLILVSRAKRLRACAVVCSDQAGNALKVAFHIFRVLCEPVSDDLVLLVRPVLDGGVETTTAWAERAVLGDNGAVGRCLEAKTPRCGRAPPPSTCHSMCCCGSKTVSVLSLVQLPIWGCSFVPRNRAPTAGADAPSSHSAPLNSLEKRAGRLISLSRAQRTSGEAGIVRETSVEGDSE